MVFPFTSVSLRFKGTSLDVSLINNHLYWDNYIGIIIDSTVSKILLDNSKDIQVINICENIKNDIHNVTVFKVQDSCNSIEFVNFITDNDSDILPFIDTKTRKMEFYGDSVTSGEVTECSDYVGKNDPPHNGEYSNCWFSYATMTARNLNANAHLVSQGGIALLDGTGYFNEPEYTGMLSAYDKTQFNSCLGPLEEWDFSRYTPDVVIVAIGQNDNHPDNYMMEDYNSKKSINWRKHYKKLILEIRKRYQKATIILITTILGHHISIDNSIDDVCKELSDDKIKHFMFTRNGCGTPGHPRIPEQEEMATELTEYINSLGEEIWK